MTTEDKAQALVDKVRSEYPLVADFHVTSIALMRTIEQHEAFRQEVSDIVYAHVHVTRTDDWEKLKTLIIPAPKPDPLVKALTEINGEGGFDNFDHYAHNLRAALDAAGFEIREKNDD